MVHNIFHSIGHWKKGALPELPAGAGPGTVRAVRVPPRQEEGEQRPHRRGQVRPPRPLDRVDWGRQQGRPQEEELQAVCERGQEGQQDPPPLREVLCAPAPPLLQGN